VLLPNHNVNEGLAVAERMRIELEKRTVSELSITASFGVSALPDHGATVDDLIAADDRAMYDAKNRGWNLVRICDESDPPPHCSRA
jgi:diguanylate cyclase (GGDEF)-like protein